MTFDKLFFRFEPPQGIELAVAIPQEDGSDEILQSFPIVTSRQIVSARYYSIIEPPKSQWHLRYNRDIPARAEVRWHISSVENPASVLVEGRFSTTEVSRELLITKEGYVCDGGSDSDHLLQVMIAPPSSLSGPDNVSVDSVSVRSEKCRQ